MTDPEYMRLREAAWRRPLTSDEKARLQGYLLVHAEAQQDWEQESALNQVLLKLPDAPLSSNFTARVLQAVELDELEIARQPSTGWLNRIRQWLPRFAVAALVLGLGGLGYEQFHLHSLNEKAHSVKLVTDTLPDLQMWQDFDAIVKLTQATASDDRTLWDALGTPAAGERR